MDPFQFVASLVSSLAWPVLILTFVLIFRRRIGELLGRIVKAKAFGGELEFDPKMAGPAVALARKDVHRGPHRRLA